MARQPEVPRGWEATLAAASAGLTLFALFTQGLIITGHERGADVIADHSEPALAVPTIYAAAIVCGLWFGVLGVWRSLRKWRFDASLVLIAAVLVMVMRGAWLPAAATSVLVGIWSAAKPRPLSS